MDSYIRYTWLFFIHNKSQAYTALPQFNFFAKTQTGYKLKAIQTNNAKEFLCFKQFTNDFGIHRRLICPHTHNQNDSIERKNKHVTNMGLTLLSSALLPIKFWAEVFMTVVHVINTLPLLLVTNPLMKYYLNML